MTSSSRNSSQSPTLPSGISVPTLTRSALLRPSLMRPSGFAIQPSTTPAKPNTAMGSRSLPADGSRSERSASRITRCAHRWTHASSASVQPLAIWGKSAGASKHQRCVPKARRRVGRLTCRSDGTQNLARDRHRSEGGPCRPPAPGRAVPPSAPVRGQGDGWARPRLSDVDSGRSGRLVHLVPQISVPDRDRHPRRAAVLHRHRRQRVGPLRHDLVVGRREPPRQLGDPHRRRVARPVLPSPLGA